MRNKVKAYATGWYKHTKDLKELADKAKEVQARGYKALKFDPFGPGGREISRADLHRACLTVEAAGNAIGEEMDILLEFHGRFSPIMAKRSITVWTLASDERDRPYVGGGANGIGGAMLIDSQTG